jgi:hypothetical protein
LLRNIGMGLSVSVLEDEDTKLPQLQSDAMWHVPEDRNCQSHCCKNVTRQCGCLLFCPVPAVANWWRFQEAYDTYGFFVPCFPGLEDSKKQSVLTESVTDVKCFIPYTGFFIAAPRITALSRRKPASSCATCDVCCALDSHKINASAYGAHTWRGLMGGMHSV